MSPPFFFKRMTPVVQGNLYWLLPLIHPSVDEDFSPPEMLVYHFSTWLIALWISYDLKYHHSITLPVSGTNKADMCKGSLFY